MQLSCHAYCLLHGPWRLMVNISSIYLQWRQNSSFTQEMSCLNQQSQVYWCVQGSNFLIFCLLMIYKPLCNASAAVCTHFYPGIVALIFTLHLTCLALYCECCQSPLPSLFSCPLSSYTRLILNIIIPNDVYLQLCYHQFCFPTVAIWLVKP